MTYKGYIRGNCIIIEDHLPFPDGQTVSVSVEANESDLPLGSPAAVRRAMHEAPHVDPRDVDELERIIRAGRILVQDPDIFDSDQRA